MLYEEVKKEVQQNILPYWMNKMIDEKYGGFLGRRDGYDRVVEQSPKAIVLNTRILWTFSQAYRFLKDEKYLPVAKRAYDYLIEFFWDKEYDGVFWMVDYQGKPIAVKKQIYGQAFAMYAFAEYYMASKQKESLDYASKIFDSLEKHSYDPEYGGYFEALDRDWSVLEDQRLSLMDANEKKSMNTNLHVLEALTNLYRCWPTPLLKERLTQLIDVFRKRILNSRAQFQLFFEEDWKVKSDVISFGHDIEGSWLLCEAAEQVGDKKLIDEVEELAIKMVDITLREGFDKDGSILYEADPSGITNFEKHWWPQAEALVGLINAWQITKKQHYRDAGEKVWKFIKENLVDKENGEWFSRVNKGGVADRSNDKAGPWKAPYHNSRAMMEVMRRMS